MVSLHPGPDFDRYAAAALGGITAEGARHVLGLLTRSHLLQSTGPGRYAMHDLLRAYGRDLSADQDPPEDQRAALTSLFDQYLHTAATAMDILFPADRDRRPRNLTAPATTQRVNGPAAARDWLDAERATLIAVTAHTADQGWAAHATRLDATLFSYLHVGDFLAEATTSHTHACRAARRAGDRAAEAAALSALGLIEWMQGRFRHAADYHQQALALCRKTGDRAGEGHAVGRLGLVDCSLGRLDQAQDRFRHALTLLRETGDRIGEAHALASLGWADQLLGRFQQAASHLRQALDLFREIGEPSGAAEALNGLGETLLATDCPDHACTLHATALRLATQIGDLRQQARAHRSLGDAYRATGDVAQTRRHWQQALTLYTHLHDPEAHQVRVRFIALDDHSQGRPGSGAPG